MKEKQRKLRYLCQKIYLNISDTKKATMFRVSYYRCFGHDIIYSIGDIVIGWHADIKNLKEEPWRITDISLTGNNLYVHTTGFRSTGIEDIRYYIGEKEPVN